MVTPPPAETKPAPVAEVKAPVEEPPVVKAPEKTVAINNPEPVPPTEPKTYSTTPNLLSDGTTKDEELFYRLRLGYEYAHFGGSENTWRLGAKVYYLPQNLRDGLEGQTNRLVAALVPDVYAEVGHAAVASTIAGVPVIGDGVHLGIGAFWPWLAWSNNISWMTNSNSRLLHFSLARLPMPACR